MGTQMQAQTWRGHTAYDCDGEKIGTIDEIYLDRETDQPEWAVVTHGAVRHQADVRAAR